MAGLIATAGNVYSSGNPVVDPTSGWTSGVAQPKTVVNPTPDASTGAGILSSSTTPSTTPPVSGSTPSPTTQPISAPALPAVASPTASTPANVASTPAPTPSAPRDIGAKETVSGQLNDLLKQDSPYMQSAKNQAMVQANARGLINSSLAVGTAQTAAINAAEPIAATDAGIYSQSALSAQQSNQDKSLSGYNASLASAQNAQNFGFTTAENAQNIKGNMDIQQQAQQANLVIQNMQISEQAKASLTSAVSPIIQQVQSEISKIQSTPDSVLSPDAKTAAINYQQQSLQTQLQTISTLYGYNVTWNTTNSTTPTTATAEPGTVAAPATPFPNPLIPPTQSAAGQGMINGNADTGG